PFCSGQLPKYCANRTQLGPGSLYFLTLRAYTIASFFLLQRLIMIDPKLLRNNIEAVNLALAKRGVQLHVEEWASLEARRQEIQSKTETLQAERNAGAKQGSQIKKAGRDASEIMTRMSAIGDEIKAAEAALAELQAELEEKLLSIPNLPDEAVPEGKDESDNVEILKWGTLREFDFEIKDHTDLGEMMGGL